MPTLSRTIETFPEPTVLVSLWDKTILQGNHPVRRLAGEIMGGSLEGQPISRMTKAHGLDEDLHPISMLVAGQDHVVQHWDAPSSGMSFWFIASHLPPIPSHPPAALLAAHRGSRDAAIEVLLKRHKEMVAMAAVAVEIDQSVSAAEMALQFAENSLVRARHIKQVWFQLAESSDVIRGHQGDAVEPPNLRAVR